MQRFAITSQADISREDLALRREALQQDILNQNREFGLRTTQQEIDKALREAGLSNERENLRVTEELGRLEAERAAERLRQQQLQQEFENTLLVGGLPGFENPELFPGLTATGFDVPPDGIGGIPPGGFPEGPPFR